MRSGDHLYVAAGAAGVGVLHLRKPRLASSLEHVPAPSGRPVRFVTKGRGGLYLHTPGRGGIASEWLPIG